MAMHHIQQGHTYIFPIGSYVKTMSTDGGHLGWSFGSLDIILKVDHLRTIHAMFALNWLTDFRGNFFPSKMATFSRHTVVLT
jgi:hypothetical protein